MIDDGTKQGARKQKAMPRSDAPFRSVIVPVDLSAGADRVLGRLPLLPLADDCHVSLLHVVPDRLSPTEQRSAVRDAKKALATEARHLKSSLPATVIVDPLVEVGVVHKAIAARATALDAELVVMGRCSGRGLRAMFLGSTAERVVRQGRLPVLVVRLRPRASYVRPALALDFDRAAHAAVALLLRVAQRPSVTVIHAFEPRFRSLAYPSLATAEEQEHLRALRNGIEQELRKLLASALAESGAPAANAPHWKQRVRDGSPRLVIAEAVKKADTDLLVLGTHGHAGVAHMFLGTVAGDVLRDVDCDVLIVPPARRARKKNA